MTVLMFAEMFERTGQKSTCFLPRIRRASRRRCALYKLLILHLFCNFPTCVGLHV